MKKIDDSKRYNCRWQDRQARKEYLKRIETESREAAAHGDAGEMRRALQKAANMLLFIRTAETMLVYGQQINEIQAAAPGCLDGMIIAER